MPTYDLLVVGSGSAGSTVASEARAAGWTVAVVDKQPLGGTCANRGCDPKKVLVGATAALDAVRNLQGNGPQATDLAIDWPALMRFKRTFTDPVPAARERAMTDAGIEVWHGTARFLNASTLSVGDSVLEARRAIVLACGARPVDMPIDGREHLATSDAFLALPRLPASIVFVGGGFISMEFAHVAARAGVKVTIVHRSSTPLDGFDPDLVEMLVARTRQLGVDVRLGANVSGVQRLDGRYRVALERGGLEASIDADLVVHGAGRVPDTDGLDCDAGGVTRDGHGIRVDARLQSVSNPRVWAAGDCASAGEPALTPTATSDGQLVADNLLRDANRVVDTRVVPSCVFTLPALARVGLSEADAKLDGRAVQVRHDATAAWFSSRRLGETASAYKVIIDPGTDAILGAHLLGSHADEVINVFAVAMQSRMTASTLKETRLVYPTNGSDIRYML